MSDEMFIRWTAALIDPYKDRPAGDGTGRTPEEAYDRLVQHLRWKANREHKAVSRVDAALEVALREDVAALGSAESS